MKPENFKTIIALLDIDTMWFNDNFSKTMVTLRPKDFW